MSQSPLFGRRIHITGSVNKDSNIATSAEVQRARSIVELLVKTLMRKGATFVIPVDAEKKREDDECICFDWLILDTVHKNIASRPADAPMPLVVTVKHHKNEEQIPEQHLTLWNTMKRSPQVFIESAAQWNMNSKRMEIQAQQGDILITLGGDEGVLFLANLYHEVGKPIIPLNLQLCEYGKGSLKLFEFGLNGNNASRLFQTNPSRTSKSWLNQIEISSTTDIRDYIEDVMGLLEALARPRAFVIRMLNPTLPEFEDVDNFFTNIVKPVIQDDLGYELVVVDGAQSYQYSRIDEEIFNKLHRSSIVLADFTGARPNCFIEMGYALGRGIPTMLLAKAGTSHPFDISSLSAHHWSIEGSTQERRDAFREHWNAIQTRPPLVSTEPLIP